MFPNHKGGGRPTTKHTMVWNHFCSCNHISQKLYFHTIPICFFRKSNNYIDFFCLFWLSIKNFQVDQVKTNNKFCETNPGFVDSELVAGIPWARWKTLLHNNCAAPSVEFFSKQTIKSLLGPYELTFAIKKALSKTDDVYYLYSSN